MLTARRNRRIDALEGKLQELAVPSFPFARIAVSKRRPLQDETIADQSLVVMSQVHPILVPAHRHARRAAVRLNPLRRRGALQLVGRPPGDVSSNSVLGTWPCQQLVARNLATVNEGDIPVGGASVDREDAEARGHVEVRDFTRPVAGEGALHCHKHGSIAVEYALHEVQVVPERPAEVRLATVACQREGRVAAFQRIHADERERVRNVQASASRRRAAHVVAADGRVGDDGGRG